MAHSSQTNVMDTHDEAISMDLRYDAEIFLYLKHQKNFLWPWNHV